LVFALGSLTVKQLAGAAVVERLCKHQNLAPSIPVFKVQALL